AGHAVRASTVPAAWEGAAHRGPAARSANVLLYHSSRRACGLVLGSAGRGLNAPRIPFIKMNTYPVNTRNRRSTSPDILRRSPMECPQRTDDGGSADGRRPETRIQYESEHLD